MKKICLNNYSLAITLLTLTGCVTDYYDHRLVILNNTGKSIIVETYPENLPDVEQTNNTEYYLQREIEPGAKSDLEQNGKNGWPNFITNSKNKRLNLVVYSWDSLLKYKSIDSLISKRIYTSYHLSQDTLTKLNWVVNIK